MARTVTCRECGENSPAADRYCPNCEALLPRAGSRFGPIAIGMLVVFVVVRVGIKLF